MSDRAEDRSHDELRRRFRRLPAPDLDALGGRYTGGFPQPRAYELACRWGMAATGLGGWHGKRFESREAGATEARVTNLVRREEVKPMVARIDSSLYDGAPALVCTYRRNETPPYRWVRDEFRQWDECTLLGLAFLDVPVLRGVGFPFVLRRDDSA